jgi:hypothetical protein
MNAIKITIKIYNKLHNYAKQNKMYSEAYRKQNVVTVKYA